MVLPPPFQRPPSPGSVADGPPPLPPPPLQPQSGDFELLLLSLFNFPLAHKLKQMTICIRLSFHASH